MTGSAVDAMHAAKISFLTPTFHVCVGRRAQAKLSGTFKCLSARVVVATVRGYEHGDGRSAIGFDFVVVHRQPHIEANDIQENRSFE
jgi:hypothetical protein